ncbi:hypothetical protein LTR94_030587, partial [Friedmanniomyces endolithicus]
DRVRADQAASHFGFQELRRSGRSGHRTGADRRCRAQWLRQVESARSAALDDGRKQPEVDARRRDGGRDLRRHRDPPAARLRRGVAARRGRSPRRRAGKRNRPPDRARGRQRLSHRRSRRARQGRATAVCRFGDRRAQPRAGQPEPHRRDHRGAPGRAARDAGGSGRDRRAACPAQGCRAEIARGRG